MASLVLGVLVVALLLGFASVAMADDAKGTIKSADKDKLVVTDKDKKDLTFAVNDKTKVTIDGKEGKYGDLKKDQSVTVTYTKDGDKMTATAIAASK
jgi:hypothetical protein